MKWVKTSEQLPPDSFDELLVLRRVNPPSVGYWYVTGSYHSLRGNYPFSSSEDRYLTPDEVTHWCLIEEPEA